MQLSKIPKSYDRKKRQFARDLRRNATPHEVYFQRAFQSAKARGRIPKCNMMSQRIVCGFIADFLIEKFKIFIELDGSSHYAQSEYDKTRDAIIFKQTGYAVVRISNRDARNKVDAVICELVEIFNRFEAEGYHRHARIFIRVS